MIGTLIAFVGVIGASGPALGADLVQIVRSIRDAERTVRAGIATHDREALAAPRRALLANHAAIIAATKPGELGRIFCGVATQTLLNMIYDIDLPPDRVRAALLADDREYRRQMADCERSVRSSAGTR
ncbi:hypothetical protein PQJ75_13745 [Rhodoplanes sp. TEM]|uniref:Uncharacterized protein n=1 Tax=Rhodoplanes tepidamans TaxID=200616 RepID=A0ABT5JDH0_RHOTP|nr:MULTISPECIES: hypothetical protein [Rhodoplanes]MDC7787324.1 hypothetical protein [Rhodoplanes tepidamans]MDC7984794.1 hypothetical protein [Rhodoplanes sp. TEM]